ncbi:hypothetical protein PQR39_35170 [Paraburkholderia sediminicola]|uniref:hypothetical protein n=1 Tax=Paraburkholderia sediminicola TaxID=458836 RepID=UPI0038B8F8DE
MSLFVIIATTRRIGLTARVAQIELTARLEVQAGTLHDAYRTVRTIPEFKHAHLRPE